MIAGAVGNLIKHSFCESVNLDCHQFSLLTAYSLLPASIIIGIYMIL